MKKILFGLTLFAASMFRFTADAQKTVGFSFDNKFGILPGNNLRLTLKGASVTIIGTGDDSVRIAVNRKITGYSHLVGPPDLSVDVVEMPGFFKIADVKKGIFEKFKSIYVSKQSFEVLIYLPANISIAVDCEKCKVLLKDVTGTVSGRLVDTVLSAQSCADIGLLQNKVYHLTNDTLVK